MIRLFMPLIIHVTGAVTDTEETYGAYVAAENHTFNNTHSSNCNGNFQKCAKILRTSLRAARSAKLVDLFISFSFDLLIFAFLIFSWFWAPLGPPGSPPWEAPGSAGGSPPEFLKSKKCVSTEVLTLGWAIFSCWQFSFDCFFHF